MTAARGDDPSRAGASSAPPTANGQAAASNGPVCELCAGPWRDLGHCKGVCLRCGFMQSCADTV